MILSDSEIREAITAPDGGVSIDPFDEAAVEPASYDLRVGPQAASSSTRKVTDLAAEGFMEIKPGDFVIVTTHEVLKLDDRHVGRFGLTSAHARRGLIATVGPQVDPGFHGRLTVGLTNLSTRAISLSYKDSFLTLEIHRLERPARRPYAGRYQGRVELAPDDIQAVMDREYMSQTDMMRTLEALVSTVESLKASVVSVEKSFGRSMVYFGLYLALFTGIIGALLAFLD